MADFPALPFFTDAYLRDCWHLSDAEHGRYLLLLMLIWQTPGCRIPNEREWISRKLRRSIDAFDTEIAPLISEFCQTDGNWITQKRLTREFYRLKKTSKTQADKAKSRWNKEKTPYRGDADVMPERETRHASGNTSLPTPTPTPTPTEDKTTNVVFLDPAASGDDPKREEAISKSKNGTRLPHDWLPLPEDCDVGYESGLSEDEIRHEHRKFTDYWRGVSGQKGRKMDWNATFRNWLRKSADDKRNRSAKRQ